MKKNVFLLALGIVFFPSCSNDNDVINEERMETATFTVSSSEEATRAYWVNHSVYWNSTDVVKVFATNHTDGSDFVIKDKNAYEASMSAIAFTGKTYLESTVHNHEYIFVYPAERALNYDGDNAVTVTIPAVQTATLNSFDPSACIQIGSTGSINGSVSLLNVCAFLKINVTEPCDWVKVTADGKYGVGGKVKVNKEAVIDSEWIDRYTTVTLNDLKESGTYLIAIGPSQDNYPEINVEVKFKRFDKTLKNHVGSFSITKGRVYNLGTCNVPSENNGDDNSGVGGEAGGSNEGSGDEGFGGR